MPVDRHQPERIAAPALYDESVWDEVDPDDVATLEPHNMLGVRASQRPRYDDKPRLARPRTRWVVIVPAALLLCGLVYALMSPKTPAIVPVEAVTVAPVEAVPAWDPEIDIPIRRRLDGQNWK